MGPVWSVGGREDSRTTLWSLACVAGITHLPSTDMGRSAEVFVLLTKLKKKNCFYVEGRGGSGSLDGIKSSL